MPPAHYWYEIPTTLFAGDTSDWIAVLPIAAIEQHGPHLPVGVDTIKPSARNENAKLSSM